MTDVDRIRRLLGKDVVAWRPTKDTDQPRMVVGTVTKTALTTSDYDGSAVHVIELESEDVDHLWRVAGWQSVLNRELADARPRVGDTVGVAYLGESPSSTSGRGAFHRFRVHVEHVAPPVDDTPGVEAPPPDDVPPYDLPPEEEPF